MKVRAALATVLLGLALASCTSEAATPDPAPVTTSTTALAKVTRTLTLTAESPSQPTKLSYVNYTCGDYTVSACEEQIPVDTWTKTVQIPVGQRITMTVYGGTAHNSCTMRAEDGTVLAEERYTGHCEAVIS